MNRQRAPLGRRDIIRCAATIGWPSKWRAMTSAKTARDRSIGYGRHVFGRLRIRSGLRDCNKSYRCLHTGSTNSPNFPNNNAFHANFSGGAMDALSPRLNQSGTGIVYSTYLGGTNTDSGQAIAGDAQGSALCDGQHELGKFSPQSTVQSYIRREQRRLYYED